MVVGVLEEVWGWRGKGNEEGRGREGKFGVGGGLGRMEGRGGVK